MTMHLMGPAFTTTNTRKQKHKTSNSQTNKYTMEWIEHKRQCKRLGMTVKTLEEYILYRQGKYKPVLRGVGMPEPYVSDHKEKYKSLGGIGVGFAKTPNKYTGTLIKGIATMHKSNAVPVINKEQAEEISRMRRG